ncbi:glycosyl hydrolase family 28-related protein [Skermanella rosea]|uniref:glycosyl hydrolase family 28-related protein n=1 Tax=Skermanella rosea TaxID=1817965 RepID=UPI0019346A09|nr:glycosyl hydrolase family 28-related protein [Skermanella rosea]
MTGHIKIGAVPPRRHYIADGTQRAFAYPFPIFASEDIEVHLDAALQTGGFTVTGSGATAGGTVTFDVAPPEGVQVTLLRRLPYERVTDFLESGALPARSLNDEFDYLTACVQQLADDALLTLRYAATDLPASSLLPGRAARANRLLAFDGGGNPTVTPAVDADALSSFVAPGAGAVRRSIRDKLADVASVRDYGAVGDGIADDTLAIQAALTAATSVFVPPGTYRVTGTLPVGYGQTLHGSGAGSILRADGEGFPVVLLPDSYASLHHLRIEQGSVGIKLTGRDGPCVQNAVHDVTVWDTGTGIVLDGGDSPDRPCYWNNLARVLVVRHLLHGVHLVRTGEGDTPNANKFHCVRVYSLAVPSAGSGFYVQHGRYNNAFVDCEANLSTTAHSCFRIGPDTDKNLLVNLYTESVGGVPNVYLEAGSKETSITNLFSASGGPAIWDQSGGEFTAYNAGYPAKNRFKRSQVTDLTVEAMRYETRFVDPVAGGLVLPDMTRSVHLVSAFNGAVEFRLPAPPDAEGRSLTVKKMDLSGNAVTVTDATGSGPDGRPFPLGSRYDFVTVVSNGAAWWITAAHAVPGNAGFFEGGSLFEPDLARGFYLVSAYGGPTEVRLPAPSATLAVGRTVTIKKSDVSGNAVTVTQAGGGGPDGEAIALVEKGHAVTAMSNGAAWHILARNP